MMHIVGPTFNVRKHSDPKDTSEPQLVDNPNPDSPSIDGPIVTIEVPAQGPIEDHQPKAVRPTFASKNNLTALNIVSVKVTPTRSEQGTPTQLTTYSVNKTHRYLQPYPLLSTPPSPPIRRRAAPKLPWLECGGGLAAFTIISGVIAIDGMKQSPTAPRPTDAQQTRPTIARLPDNPTTIPQVSVGELLNTGRTLPVPAGAMNFPQQTAMNSSLQNPGLNSGTAEMNSIVIQKDLGTLAATPPQAAPRRKAIAPPESLPQAPIRTIPQPIQPSPLPPQPNLQQSSPVNSSNPPFTPQAVQSEPSQAMPKSQDPQFLEVPTAPVQPAPTSSSAFPPLQNDPNTSPTTLKPIRSSTISPSAKDPSPLSDRTPIILEANPQAATSATMSSATSSATMSNDAFRLEVSKL